MLSNHLKIELNGKSGEASSQALVALDELASNWLSDEERSELSLAQRVLLGFKAAINTSGIQSYPLKMLIDQMDEKSSEALLLAVGYALGYKQPESPSTHHESVEVFLLLEMLTLDGKVGHKAAAFRAAKTQPEPVVRTRENPHMLRKLEGKITSFRAVTKRNVLLEIQGIEKIIDLTVSEPWVINRGDSVVVSGEDDANTGKFIGYAYRNKTKGVFGRYNAGGGYFFVIVGLLLFWAIFPLFMHVPYGLRLIALDEKIRQAASMIAP